MDVRVATVEVDGLAKRFGGREAVVGATFTVRRGEVFALLGPDGAGKSTLVGMLCGSIRPSAGTARVAGCPDVVVLDEPTRGLDSQRRAAVWAHVLRMRSEHGTTVLFTTSSMEEAEHADRLAVIDHGRIVAVDTPAGLQASMGADRVELRTADDGAAASALRRAGYPVATTIEGMTISVADAEAAVPSLIAKCGVPVRQVHVHRPTLEDVFLAYTT